MTINKHLQLEPNATGRDFVVGDLHGMVDYLNEMLIILNFDNTNDRLISTGDLVDRGPKSFETAQLIYEPWFYSVRGNHEQMMIDALLYYDYSCQRMWAKNGGMWANEYAGTGEKYKLLDLARDMNHKLPLIITVGEGDNAFNVVHADLVKRDIGAYGAYHLISQATIEEWDFNSNDEESMLWGRNNIYGIGVPAEKYIKKHADTLPLTFVGHTPIVNPIQVERQLYIDTGATYYHCTNDDDPKEEYALTIAEPNKQLLYRYSLHNKSMNITKFDDVVKHHQINTPEHNQTSITHPTCNLRQYNTPFQ